MGNLAVAVSCLFFTLLLLPKNVVSSAQPSCGYVVPVVKVPSESCPNNFLVPGFWDQQNIQNFLLATIPKELDEMSFCFYYGPNSAGPLEAATDSSKEAWLMSIASETEHNEWLIGIRALHLFMHGEPEANWITDDLLAFTQPHRHCFVWKQNTFLTWFYDRTVPGVLELIATVGDSGKNSIPAGTSVTILNDQDTFGGGLVTSQMMPGLVTDFQIWDCALTDYEVLYMPCGKKGNMLTFDDFKIQGTQKMGTGSKFICTVQNN